MRSPLIFRIFKNGQLVGVRQFDQDQIVVGHNADVHLDLEGDGVSPIHCLIELRDSGWYVCDLGSSQGTFKNGQAILDQAISSGDEIEVGPYRIAFFIGVPKAKGLENTFIKEVPPQKPVVPESAPLEVQPAVEPPKAAEPVVPAPQVDEKKVAIPEESPIIPTDAPVFDEKPVLAAALVRPEVKKERHSYKKEKKRKTFAPPSEVKNLKEYLKPGKGTAVEVLVTWKERILTTYHFTGRKAVRVNTGADRQIALPEGLVKRGFPLLDMSAGLRVNVTHDMEAELVSSQGNRFVQDLLTSGKAQSAGAGYSVAVDQNEMLCVTLPGGNICLYIRFAPQAPKVAMLPPFMLSGSEMTGVVMSILIAGLLALYVSATTPNELEENKQEEVQRIAQVVFNNPPPKPTPPPEPPPPPAPKPTPTPTPTPVAKPTPTPTPKKVVVADLKKDTQKKGTSKATKPRNQVAARASEVAPKPNAQDRTKKFTSTRQGGAIKTGKTAGANAASANKDISKVGLFSAFGGGGSRAKIDKAYSGAGEVLGMADKATGTSGFNEDRGGNDLGSKFKDSGAGGKGTATQGIAGIGTKGRGSGQAAYGAAEGFGSKTTVAIESGGFEESFDPTIDKEAIRRVIRSKLNEVRSCYERALNTLAKGQRMEGKVVLGWEIIEKGQARNVKVVSSTLGNRGVEDCIRRRLASWVFPEPPTGMTAEVQAYPFVLNQAN